MGVFFCDARRAFEHRLVSRLYSIESGRIFIFFVFLSVIRQPTQFFVFVVYKWTHWSLDYNLNAGLEVSLNMKLLTYYLLHPLYKLNVLLVYSEFLRGKCYQKRLMGLVCILQQKGQRCDPHRSSTP